MEAWIAEIEKELRVSGQILLDADRTHAGIDEKEGHGNFVTRYDKMLQERLKVRLGEILPDATFVGEEEEKHASIKKGYAFIVDPIDGTINFIRDYHNSCISVGVTKDGAAFAGVVYNPYLDEMYTAQKGCGAFLNGKRLHVTENGMDQCIVSFGTAPYYEELQERTFKLGYAFFKAGLDLRRSGSGALDLCSIAAGRLDLFFECRICPWDCAAGIVLIEEAGGKVTDLNGNPVSLEGPTSILAGNPQVMKEAAEIIRKI